MSYKPYTSLPPISPRTIQNPSMTTYFSWFRNTLSRVPTHLHLVSREGDIERLHRITSWELVVSGPQLEDICVLSSERSIMWGTRDDQRRIQLDRQALQKYQAKLQDPLIEAGLTQHELDSLHAHILELRQKIMLNPYTLNEDIEVLCRQMNYSGTKVELVLYFKPFNDKVILRRLGYQLPSGDIELFMFPNPRYVSRLSDGRITFILQEVI